MTCPLGTVLHCRQEVMTMLRNEIQKMTGLTRKAIEYYEENDNVIQDRLALLENEENI